MNHGPHSGGSLACIVGTADLSGIETVFVQSQSGHNSENEHDDAIAPYPLRETSPKQDRLRQFLNIGYYCRTSRSKS